MTTMDVPYWCREGIERTMIHMKEQTTEVSRARRRALRAAQVVTLGLALAGGGCSAAHTRSPAVPNEPEPEAQTVADTGTVDANDAGSEPEQMADAGAFCAIDDPNWAACCEALGWPCDWDVQREEGWGCCAWGPYVPPGEELPESRVTTQRFRAAA